MSTPNSANILTTGLKSSLFKNVQSTPKSNNGPKAFYLFTPGNEFPPGKLKRRAALGPILDDIAGLRGTFRNFFKAIQNGLELSHDLYEKTI